MRMETYLKSVIISLITVTFFSCSTGKNLSESNGTVTPLSSKITAPEGSLVYALPLSVIDIKIDAERIIEKPGPYSRYAEDLLGLKDIIKNERVYWNIKGITVKSHIELDPSEFYVIEASSIFRTNVLSLKKEGLILDLNPEIYNRCEGTGSGIIDQADNSRLLDLGADEYFQERRDTVYRVVNVDTAFIRIPYLVEKKQKLTYENLAERAARRLMEMREGKHAILTGETNVFPQNEFAIDEMNRLEKEYTDLFAGKIFKESRTFSYQVIPSREMAGKPVTLCNFSDTEGALPSTNKTGNPVTLEFIPELKTKALTIVSHSKSDSQKSKYDKLFYRYPDVVKIKISFGSETLNSSRQLIYQFGEVIQLPSNFIIGK
jgi:hypothetical protein